MAWTTRVLSVIDEYKNKDGDLKYRWEITRPENDETGKHFSSGVQKTSYYKKDGEQRRGYPQALTLSDLNFLRDNWEKIIASMVSKPEAVAPKEETDQNEQQEVPF